MTRAARHPSHVRPGRAEAVLSPLAASLATQELVLGVSITDTVTYGHRSEHARYVRGHHCLQYTIVNTGVVCELTQT